MRAKRWRPGNVLGWLYGCLLAAFLLVPVFIMIPASVTPASILEFPPSGVSGKWYSQVLNDPDWLDSAGMSLRVSVISAVIAVLAGLCIGLLHYRQRGLSVKFQIFLLLPLMVPTVIVATGMFTMLLNTGILGSATAVAIADAALALPMVIVFFLTTFETLDPNLWFAGSSLGAKPRTIALRILLPELTVSIVAACLVAFQSAWDETTFAVFIGPSTVPLLPARMFTDMQQALSPSITAVASLLLGMALVLALVIAVVARLRHTRAAKALEASTQAGTSTEPIEVPSEQAQEA